MQAREDIEKGTAERQQVLLEARTRETERVQQELKDLQAKQTERGMVLTLGDVLFDTGKATLKPGAYTTIDRLAQVLNSSKGSRVVIEGHTDSMGSDANNQALSEQRAQSVESALLQRGVSASQLRSVGKGESTPVAGNDTGFGSAGESPGRADLLARREPRSVRGVKRRCFSGGGRRRRATRRRDCSAHACWRHYQHR